MGDKWDEIAATIPLHAVPYDEQQTESDKRQLRFEGLLEACLGVEGLRKIPPPQPLVDSFLFQDSLSWFSGGWGQGKSFGAVDVGLCVATGTPWHGHDVQQGHVLYLIAEGASGLSLRVDAWEEATGVEVANITFLPIPVQIGKSASTCLRSHRC